MHLPRPPRRVVPILLLTLFPLLAACGHTDPKTPTAPTSAMISAMLVATDAIVSNVAGTRSSTPFSESDPPPPDDNSGDASAVDLMQGLADTNAPFTPLGSTSDCYSGGTVVLNGADVNDQRVAGYGLVTLTINGMQATASACKGHGLSVNGAMTLTVNDTLNIAQTSDSNINRWTLTRSESANGSVQITRLLDNALFSVTFNWSRNGTIKADYNIFLQDIVGAIDVDQSLYIQANGQACSGHMTAVTLFGSYAWNCQGN